jgi:hypothetical protein
VLNVETQKPILVSKIPIKFNPTRTDWVPMKQKANYKVSNWKDYNRSLINRGNLSVWISDEAIVDWNATISNGRKGRSKTYSDLAIETALTLRGLLRLPLRQTQGFIEV